MKRTETESKVTYQADLSIEAERRALSGVTLPGVTDSCESKGEPEVDQTNGSPSALM